MKILMKYVIEMQRLKLLVFKSVLYNTRKTSSQKAVINFW